MPSTGGALRTVLIDANIAGITGVFRDFAPPSQAHPYITYSDEISNIPVLIGDGFALTRNKMVQVDLWQDRAIENVDLIDDVISALDGVGQIDATKSVFRVRVSNVVRIVSTTDSVVHHAVTLDIYQRS